METAQDKGDDSTRQAFSSTMTGCDSGDHFLADSTASMHMCKSAELFNSMDDSQTKIKVANKQYMQAYGRGTINILVNIDGK